MRGLAVDTHIGDRSIPDSTVGMQLLALVLIQGRKEPLSLAIFHIAFGRLRHFPTFANSTRNWCISSPHSRNGRHFADSSTGRNKGALIGPPIGHFRLLTPATCLPRHGGPWP